MERIDKIISTSLGVSRSEAARIIRSGSVEINGKIIKSPGDRAEESSDCITCNGEKIEYNKFVYIMMNKPQGVISASSSDEETVIDILPEGMKRKNLFPAGRLDRDTTGFMLITDDGDFAHRILSPKRHIPKTYEALLDKPFDSNVVRAFEQGVVLKECVCMPAQLEALGGDCTKAVVTIRQGMYHQIKRMFASFGITVLELKRVAMGCLRLDPSLAPGECRYLTPEELALMQVAQKK